MKQPTISEKIEKLYNYCSNMDCSDCPIDKENPLHSCGCGKSYYIKDRDIGVSDEEVNTNYKIVFGEEQKEEVNHPSRYSGECSLECIEVMRVTFGNEAVYHFCLCNAFKYLWRYKNKNGEEDIKKSRWYLDYVLHDIEHDGDYVPYEVHDMYERLNDLYIDITDKIANEG